MVATTKQEMTLDQRVVDAIDACAHAGLTVDNVRVWAADVSAERFAEAVRVFRAARLEVGVEVQFPDQPHRSVIARVRVDRQVTIVLKTYDPKAFAEPDPRPSAAPAILALLDTPPRTHPVSKGVEQAEQEGGA